MSTFRYILFWLGFLTFASVEVKATHIKAADLYATINPNNVTSSNSHRIVRFTLTVYCRQTTVCPPNGTGGCPSNSDCSRNLGSCAELDFGDGSKQTVSFTTAKLFNNDTYQFVYYFDHTYPSDRFYSVHYQDENRNAGIKNLQGQTDQLPFYIEMGVKIENGLGVNQTPKMTIAPVDNAEMYRTFIHNPGAFDVNGDSISYRSFIPQVLPGTYAPGYVNPNVASGGGTQENANVSATYSVDPVTGDVKWDAPSQLGLYNVAFIIEEWRTIGNSKELLSYTIRDMQIEVKPGVNKQPVIDNLQNVCIEAGTIYSKSIYVDDESTPKDRVTLELFGELEGRGNPTFLTPSIDPQNPIISTRGYRDFRWATSCSDVRTRPYQVFFKATDLYAANPLTDIKSFFINVVGPRPRGLQARIEGQDIRLRWDTYSCPAGFPGAYRMQIYRRVGCDSIQPANCQTGAPDGYVLVGEVNVTDTTFIDATTKRGNVYSYRLVATFRDQVNLLSYSYASANTCVSLPIVSPVITKVSFEGQTKDELLITWSRPLEVDTSKVRGPYTYELFRKESGTTQFSSLVKFSPQDSLKDGSYLDTTIQPLTDYTYFVQLTYSEKDTAALFTDSSEVASNVSLTARGVDKGIGLSWQASTPWSNSIATLYHYIWRKRETDASFVLIDSVAFEQGTLSYSYADLGKTTPLKEKEIVAYYVTTSGSYQNLKIVPIVTLNNSYIAIAEVLDTTPPCPPVLETIVYDCEKFNQTNPYFNLLNWRNVPFSVTCDDDIAAYKIYYSRKRDEDPIPFLVQLNGPDETAYKHANLPTVSACYVVTALDSTGNESARSNVVCVEPCKSYELPNVFTPNNSGDNDIFRPLPPSPVSVESVEFKVFNRWGQKVFERNDDIYLNWDGSGLPDGVYFYSAKVKFVSLDQDDSKEMKGWIQIVR